MWIERRDVGDVALKEKLGGSFFCLFSIKLCEPFSQMRLSSQIVLNYNHFIYIQLVIIKNAFG